MKLIFFNTTYAPDIAGGAEITLQQLVEALAMKGHEVRVVCLGRLAGVHHDVVNGVTVTRIGVPGMYFPVLREDPPSALHRMLWHWKDRDNPAVGQVISRLVRDFKPDLGCCHNLSGLSIAVWKCLEDAGVSVVQVLHDQYLLCPKTTMVSRGAVCEKQCIACRVLRREHPAKSNAVDAVIGVSRYIVDRFVDAGYFGSTKKRAVIHNVRRAELFSAGERCSAGSLRIGFIGSLTPIKGIERLLQAFTAATVDGGCSLVIAGRGDESYVARLKTTYPDPRIVWLGYTTPADFFSKIDILVVPSIWNDTFPGVVFEAFGFGIPVIGSRRGGIPEMIDDGVNGFLFEPHQEGQLEALLERVSGDRGALEALAQGAICSAGKYQNMDQWVANYEELFVSLADGRTGNAVQRLA